MRLVGKKVRESKGSAIESCKVWTQLMRRRMCLKEHISRDSQSQALSLGLGY
jgi:hypothetical protein